MFFLITHIETAFWLQLAVSVCLKPRVIVLVLRKFWTLRTGSLFGWPHARENDSLPAQADLSLRADFLPKRDRFKILLFVQVSVV